MSVAIVGGGLAGFTAYQALVRGGVEPDDVTVFSPELDPASTWRKRAAAIRQTHMRSESDGHCLPTTFPGLAVREAARRRSLRPLVESVCDRYHPSVGEFLDHVDTLRARTSWSEHVVPARVARIVAVAGGFELDSVGSSGSGPFRYVLVATGHPGLALPEEVRGDPRVVHSYEPHDYAESVCVVGAGLAAATEWLNALAAGATVISVRRREPVRRPLNVPRQYLSKRGLRSFWKLEPAARVRLLQELLGPSYPPGAVWDTSIERAREEGRFRVEASVNGADQVIAATGFLRGCRHDPLLARLVEDYALETADRWLVLDPDCTVPALTDRTRTLAVCGVAGQYAYPAADTLAGARYAGHAFLRRCRTR